MMKRLMLLIVPLLLLNACATVCPPFNDPQTRSDSPLQKYRISGVAITNAKQLALANVGPVNDFDDPRSYSAVYHNEIDTLIRNSFRKPAQPGYREAQAVRVVCDIEHFNLGYERYFTVYPAKFAATLTLVDPGTNKPLFSKRYEAQAPSTAKKAPDGCPAWTPGEQALFQAINDDLTQFGNDVRGIEIPQNSNQNAPINGTLARIHGLLTVKKQTIAESFVSGDRTRTNVLLERAANRALPNALRSKVFPENLFNNSPENVYEIVVLITDYELEGSLFSTSTLKYKSRTLLVRNDKPVAFFEYSSEPFPTSEADAAFAKHGELAVAFLRGLSSKL